MVLPVVFAQAAADTACKDGGFLCQRVYDWTGNRTLADWTSFLLNRPLKILLILAVAFIVNRLARRGIRHFVEQLSEVAESESRTGEILSARTSQRALLRAQTVSNVLRSLTSIVVWTVAVILIFGELGLAVGPLIAGAGIAGVALGFGAQSLVKDFLTGFFMLVEDQYGVGDIVDTGEASGVVERVTLRTTTLRDLDGTLWHIPNGEILRVGNKSQNWARALLDIDVSYETDVDRAGEIMLQTANELATDPEWAHRVKEPPELLGVENLAPDGVTIRLTMKTEPAAQFQVQRELRARIKRALDSASIEIPFPQRTVWLRREGAAET